MNLEKWDCAECISEKMKYSINLILEKSRLKKENYVSYENKRKQKYDKIVLWEDGIHWSEEESILVTTTEEYLKWDLEMIETFPIHCALILVDEKEKWNIQRMQYQRQLLMMKSDLIVIKGMSFIRAYNILAESFRWMNQIVETFSEKVMNQRDLQEIIELFYDFLGNPAYIVDSSFKVLAIDRRNNMRELSASWRRMEDHGYLQYDIITKLMKDNELSRMEAEEKAQWVNSEHFYTPFINYTLRRKKRIAGHLFIVNMFRQITPGDIEISDILGRLIEKAMENDRKYQMQRGRLYEYFLSDILSGKISDKAEIKKQMQSLSYTEESYYMVAVLQYQSERMNEIAGERVFQRLEQIKGCKPIHYKEKVAALFPFQHFEDRNRIWNQIEQIAENFKLKVGISEDFWGYTQMHHACLQAQVALQYGDEKEKRMICFEHAALYYLKQIFDKKQDLDILEPPGLQRLREYDEQNHTDYMQTLLNYLQHERNVVETSEALFIHRNTLAYRIRKIEEITGLDLDDAAIRMRIFIANL